MNMRVWRHTSLCQRIVRTALLGLHRICKRWEVIGCKRQSICKHMKKNHLLACVPLQGVELRWNGRATRGDSKGKSHDAPRSERELEYRLATHV